MSSWLPLPIRARPEGCPLRAWAGLLLVILLWHQSSLKGFQREPGFDLTVVPQGVLERTSVPIRAESVAGDSKELSVWEGQAELNRPVRVPLSPDRPLRWVCLDEGVWCPEEVEVGSDLRASLPVFPRGRLEAPLSGPRGLFESLEVTLEFRAPARPAEKALGGRIPCSIREQTLHCQPPAGTWDLRIRPRGLAPLVSAAVAIPASGKLELAPQLLRPGGTLTGSIEAGRLPDFQPERCNLQLLPQESLHAAPADAPQLERFGPSANTHPNRRGFFSLEGLAPGSYRLKVECPGRVRGSVEGIGIRAGAESRLAHSVTVRPPLELELLLEPPLTPASEEWVVTLKEVNRNLGVAAVQAEHRLLGARGRFRGLDLAPGHYQLVVANSSGAIFLEEELSIEDSTLLERTIDLIEVEGMVRRGGNGVLATVWWGGKKIGIPARSDPDGGYSVNLPKQSFFRVEVITNEGDAWPIGFVELPRPDSRGRRVRNFEIPTGVLEVQCHDEAGAPIAPCVVSLFALRAMRFQTADGEGRVRFLNVPEGSIDLAATARGKRSGWVKVRVDKRQGAQSIPIVLYPAKRLSGLVTAEGQPVAGVTVLSEAFRADGQLVDFDTASTDATGAFELELASAAATVQVLAAASGFPLIGSAEPASAGTLLALRLGGSAAELVLEGTHVDEPLFRPWWLEFPSGFRVDGAFLKIWAEQHGIRWPAGRAIVPQLPAGEVRVCRASPEIFEDGLLRRNLQGNCEAIRLKGHSTGAVALDGERETAGSERGSVQHP